jgi:hypothetical protein
MDLLIYLAVCAAAAIGGSYLITRITLGRRRLPPKPGTTLRIRAHSGVYRSRLLTTDDNLWRMSTPLQRNHYVPLREGEPITIEAPVAGGVYLFKTTVLHSDADRNELSFLVPPLTAPRNRRQEQRWIRQVPITLDDAPATLVDVSRLGARVKTSQRVKLGDRVKLKLSEGLIVGWVIEAWPTKSGDPYAEVLRVRFETPLH